MISFKQQFPNGEYEKGYRNSKGKKHGKCYWFYENGNLKSDFNYENGKRVGNGKMWHPTGTCMIVTFKNGEIEKIKPIKELNHSDDTPKNVNMDNIKKLPEELKMIVFGFLDIGFHFESFSRHIYELNDIEYNRIKRYFMIIERKFKLNAPPERKNFINYKFLHQRLYKLVNKSHKVKKTLEQSNETKLQKLLNDIL